MTSTVLSRVFFALAVSAVAVALTLGIVNIAHAQSVTVLPSTTQQAGILVCGQGTAYTHPDQAQIEAGVQATATTAEAARSQAAQAMASVLSAIKSQGVADADVQTNYFAIEPDYDYSSSTPSIVGYTASNSVTVTVHAVDNTGNIVDAVTQAGGNDVLVNGIEFSNGNPAAALEQAQQNAIANAHQQAEVAASAAGVSLGAPLSIDLESCGGTGVATEVPAAISGAVPGASSGPSTPISPGQIEATADVSVDYAVH
ncbi:MAG: SIMPL domain-containing protein [Ktedonobacterales bacterium]